MLKTDELFNCSIRVLVKRLGGKGYLKLKKKPKLLKKEKSLKKINIFRQYKKILKIGILDILFKKLQYNIFESKE